MIHPQPWQSRARDSGAGTSPCSCIESCRLQPCQNSLLPDPIETERLWKPSSGIALFLLPIFAPMLLHFPANSIVFFSFVPPLCLFTAPITNLVKYMYIYIYIHRETHLKATSFGNATP